MCQSQQRLLSLWARLKQMVVSSLLLDSALWAAYYATISSKFSSMFHAGVKPTIKLMKKELQGVGVHTLLSVERSRGKGSLEASELMSNLRQGKECHLPSCPKGVSHTHAKGDMGCAMLLSLLHNPSKKIGSYSGFNCTALVSCSTMAKKCAAMKASGVDVVCFVASVMFRHPHLPVAQVCMQTFRATMYPQ